MNCKTCESEYIQCGGDPTLSHNECMLCELERLRGELGRGYGRFVGLPSGLLVDPSKVCAVEVRNHRTSRKCVDILLSGNWLRAGDVDELETIVAMLGGEA